MEHDFRARTQTILDFDNYMRQKCNGWLCGIDEAGRGPLAGPVVAAAVMFTDDVFIEGVFDSKKLTHNKREELFEEILDSAMCYGVGIVDNTDIDGMNIEGAWLGKTYWSFEDRNGKTKLTLEIDLEINKPWLRLLSRVMNFSKLHSKQMNHVFAALERYLGSRAVVP